MRAGVRRGLHQGGFGSTISVWRGRLVAAARG
jgi:hypothetical protein